MPYGFKGFKRPNLVLDAHMSKSRFGEGERRKGRRNLGFARRSGLVGFASHFLLLRDQVTYKRRFEEVRDG